MERAHAYLSDESWGSASLHPRLYAATRSAGFDCPFNWIYSRVPTLLICMFLGLLRRWLEGNRDAIDGGAVYFNVLTRRLAAVCLSGDAILGRVRR